jgi:hypothetical protein
MDITHEERLEFLKAHNDLRNVIQTLHECQDLWLSDVGKLEKIECLMQRVLKFVPDEDDEGRPKHYADYVLADDNNEKGE